MSITANISLPDIGQYHPRWWLPRQRERRAARAQADTLQIKPPDVDRAVAGLSGGNQQKVVLGKWLAMRPKIMILDEPTRGVDVGAKAELYLRMQAMAAADITILLVSSEMEEILAMSDRIVVMHERRIVGVVERSQADQEAIVALMTGMDSTAGRKQI